VFESVYNHRLTLGYMRAGPGRVVLTISIFGVRGVRGPDGDRLHSRGVRSSLRMHDVFRSVRGSKDQVGSRIGGAGLEDVALTGSG